MRDQLDRLTWLEPWARIADPTEARALEAELVRELPPAHVLRGSHCEAVARGDCDDVLYVVDDARLAVVHLTWAVASLPDWPWTTALPDVGAFRRLMEEDHVEWERR